MKASLKFREEQKPLVRAKVPISVLGLPFISGVSAGEARELRLDLATAMDSGPSLRLSYRPNDPWSPFSLAVKTGIGAFGCPASAPLTMCAEFNLIGRGGPGFSIQLKPRLGDFCVRKAAGSPAAFLLGGGASAAVADHDTDGEGSADGGESPGAGFRHGNGSMFSEKPNEEASGVRSATAGGIRGLLAGTELTARSVLPLRGGTAVKFRWGVRIPSELRSGLGDNFGSRDPIPNIAPRKLPLLVMSKISIERVAGAAKRQEKPAGAGAPAGDVEEACLSVQRQLAALQAENCMLRHSVEELRADLGARRSDPVTPGAVTARGAVPEAKDRNRNGTKAPEPVKSGGEGARKGYAKAAEAGGKVTKEDVNEELKKALMGATGAGK